MKRITDRIMDFKKDFKNDVDYILRLNNTNYQLTYEKAVDLLNSSYNLNEFLDEDNIKSYDQKDLSRVVSLFSYFHLSNIIQEEDIWNIQNSIISKLKMNTLNEKEAISLFTDKSKSLISNSGYTYTRYSLNLSEILISKIDQSYIDSWIYSVLSSYPQFLKEKINLVNDDVVNELFLDKQSLDHHYWYTPFYYHRGLSKEHMETILEEMLQDSSCRLSSAKNKDTDGYRSTCLLTLDRFEVFYSQYRLYKNKDPFKHNTYIIEWFSIIESYNPFGLVFKFRIKTLREQLENDGVLKGHASLILDEITSL